MFNEIESIPDGVGKQIMERADDMLANIFNKLRNRFKKVFQQGYVSCIRFTSGAISFFVLIDVSATSG